MKTLKERALEYHAAFPAGKIAVLPTKSAKTQDDLTLAYSPGVAEVCTVIAQEPENVGKYTGKSNLVGVVTDGTAVLGLGNIGPLAAKPVMEGKGLLFKIFAGVDVFDVELNTSSKEELVGVVKALEPTFGGINLEDIKAPECFYVEEELKKIMNIPVFHDDQHGTAIISSAALINAVEITKRDMSQCKVVISGAGAAAIASAHLYMEIGIKKEHIYMFDSKGLLSKKRTDLNSYKAFFAQEKEMTLSEALEGADVFLGLSQKGLLTKDMVKKMGTRPIIFALANPDPEITYEDAKEAVADCIMGTGRSDYPNQINNVSGFPYIFRAALDCEAVTINIEMKLALVHALVEIAKMPVSEEMKKAYGLSDISFGAEYIIPKPMDARILGIATPNIVKAAMETGVAKKKIHDLASYKEHLLSRMKIVQETIAKL
ncbi:MAG: malic enzyme-like NAD(P)-binding protein [Desulfovibrionaceae bacterium]